MSNNKVSITQGPKATTIVIAPLGETSLRSIEKVLSAVGLPRFTERRSKKIYLPSSAFLKVRTAFEGWDLDVEKEVSAHYDSMLNSEGIIKQQKQILEELLNSEVRDNTVTGFPELLHLDPHQIQAVAVATHPEIKWLCLFDEQGLGKTVMTLYSYHRLRQLGEVTRLLVISPKNVVFEWLRDTDRFFGGKYKAKAIIGGKREKRNILNTPSDIYVTNFETTVSLYYRLRELLEAERKKALLVVDESFFVKNPDAQRTRAIKGLRNSVDRCIVLCGTPAPNSPHDIVEQFNIADGGIAFRGVNLPRERDAARPIVQQILKERGIYIRRLKQDVLPELPGKTFHRVLIPLQTEQERAYKAALRNYIKDLQLVDEVRFNKQLVTFMARRFMLLQICTNPASVVNGYAETPAKILALDSILNELIERQREKVIIWSFFTSSLDTIYKRYKRFNPVRFDGTIISIGDRKDAIRKFQEDDETMLFIANPAAAGAGLTLHRARYSIYESMPVQSAHYFQSLDRIHRRGQLRPVEYVILLCDRTIELNEYDRLIRKEESARRLLGDQNDEAITHTAMLKEAMEAAQLIGLTEEGSNNGKNE